MKKLIVSEMISLDGMFEAPNNDINWHIVNEEFNEYAIKLLNTADTLLFGRITYQLFESYWPKALEDPETSDNDLVIADRIGKAKKIVFSKSLDKVTWEGSELITELTKEYIEKMKSEDGLSAEASAQAEKDIIVYGSGSIVTELINMDLVDEYHIFVAPIILGEGTLLFKDMKKRHSLNLVKSKILSNGVVALHYVKS